MLWELIDRLGNTSLTIRLSGETGVGKDAGARLIQHHYPHHGAKFYCYDCQKLMARSKPWASDQVKYDLYTVLASPENHILYFKHIEDMPAEVQVGLMKLLEVQFEKATPWILISSSQRLTPHIESGRLNKDLLESLATVRVHIPPLREKPDKIPLLLAWYLNHSETRTSNALPPMPDVQTMKYLKQYSWPGNLRQLQQIAHRALKNRNWPKVIRNIETRSICGDETIDEIAAFYILSYAEISIQREKVLEKLIAASNMDDIGLLDLAFLNEAVSQIADSITKPRADKDPRKNE